MVDKSEGVQGTEARLKTGKPVSRLPVEGQERGADGLHQSGALGIERVGQWVRCLILPIKIGFNYKKNASFLKQQ